MQTNQEMNLAQERMSRLAYLRNLYAAYALENATNWVRVGNNAWLRKAASAPAMEEARVSLGEGDGRDFHYVV